MTQPNQYSRTGALAPRCGRALLKRGRGKTCQRPAGHSGQCQSVAVRLPRRWQGLSTIEP